MSTPKRKPRIKRRLSQRGFAQWPHIRDERGVNIWVAESSAATPTPRIWVFTTGGAESYQREQDGAAHLTIRQATKLRDSLTDAIRFFRGTP